MPKQKEIQIILNDLLLWREALASCAIEGNKFAIKMLNLWETNRVEYIREILRLKGEEDAREGSTSQSTNKD